MKRKNATRNSLITSIISMLLCVSMLVGATFAWFTDEVKTGMNTIAAGNLDVELLADGVEVDAATKLFDNVARWEPGVVVYENLQVANVGSLALRYQLSLNFGGENDLNGHKLSEVLQIAVIDKIDTDATREEVLTAAKASAKVGALADFYITGELEANTNSTEQTFVIFWEPSTPEVDNLYNVNNNQTTSDGKDLHIEFGVNLQATQKMSESDSFNNEYDKNAWSDAMKVYTALDLQAAINAGESAVMLMADIALDAEASVTIDAGKAVALNLNGHKISGSNAKNSDAVLVNNGTLEIIGGEVANTTNNGAAAIDNNGTLTLENVTVTGAPIVAGGYPEYALQTAGTLTVENGTVISSDRGAISIDGDGATTINGGTFTANDINQSLTSHVVDLSDDVPGTHTLTINGGVFQHLDEQTSGGVVICNRTQNTIYVNGGNFSGGNYYGNDNLSDYGYGGTFYVTGGVFDAKPAANYIAPGYVAVDNGDGTYTVVPEVPGQTLSAVPGHPGVYTTGAKTYHVFNKTGLKSLNALFVQIAPNEGNINTVNLGADVDLAGETWEPLNAMWITFNGNDHTISNLTAGMAADGRRSGFWAYAGAVTINDLTLENVTVSGSQAGTFAGAAEGMKLNNCVLKGTNTVNYVEGIETWCGIGAIAGVTTESTLNVEIASGATVTLNRGEMITAADCVYVDDLTGHIQANKGTVTNNGTVTATGSFSYMVSNAAALSKALNSSAAVVNVVLADGEYKNVLTASNKTIHIKGSKDVVISITDSLSPSHDHMGLTNCDVTLEGVTCTFAGYYPAYINNPKMTYIDCTLKGQFYLYGDTSFIGCTFDNDDEAAKTGFNYIYTYGNTNHINVLVDECVFNTQGHSLIMFSDYGGAGNVTMTVKDSKFHGGAGRTAWAVANQNTAAIEIDGSCGADYTLILEGNNTFDGGFSGLWRIKAMANGVTTTVNGVDYIGDADDVYLDGAHYIKDANRDVTIANP